MLETVTLKSSVQIALLLDHQRSSQGTKQKQMTFYLAGSWKNREYFDLELGGLLIRH